MREIRWIHPAIYWYYYMPLIKADSFCKKNDEVIEMIWTQTPPGGTFTSIEECEAYNEMIKQYDISVYDDFVAAGHEWCWCLVGNIVESHEYGEHHELKEGIKQFSKGTKVYLAPSQWGDGYENIVVIGCPRHRKTYIEIVMRSKYIENYRMQRVYKPVVLKIMINSKHRWWGYSNDDRIRIIEYLKRRNPEEAEKQMRLLGEEKMMKVTKICDDIFDI